jgi:HNH endonuclease
VQLHLVQGGIENGDKAWLERAARKRLDSPSWIAPKSAQVGDEVVIYVAGWGLFATARVRSIPRPRSDWKRRWGAALTAIRLIDPPISLGALRRALPRLEWAKYPRSIATVEPRLANSLRRLISERRRTQRPDLDDDALESANLSELRRVALLSARGRLTPKERRTIQRARSRAIHLYVLARATGRCEGCGLGAPFLKVDGSPYLEPHHLTRVADDGPDHPAKVIALCPTCHRRAHHSNDQVRFNRVLKKKLLKIEEF